jgi:hypothetical protein
MPYIILFIILNRNLVRLDVIKLNKQIVALLELYIPGFPNLSSIWVLNIEDVPVKALIANKATSLCPRSHFGALYILMTVWMDQ